jgi:hypothetical protein
MKEGEMGGEYGDCGEKKNMCILLVRNLKERDHVWCDWD